MELKVPYGKEAITIHVPDEHVLGELKPNVVKTINDAENIKTALERPLNSKPFSEFINEAKDILFIVNDATRPTPTAKVIDILYDDIKYKDIRFIVATGTHRAPTEDELAFIFGKHLGELRERIIIHDSKDQGALKHFTTTARGTEVYLNRAALEADKLVIISSVEPHYFAGYTGGRKSFLPGLAGYSTIEQNHKFALDPAAKTLKLAGNPIHEDMVDATKKMRDREVFNINLVLDNYHNIYSVSAGELESSFLAAVEKANEVFCVKIQEKADIVVTVAPYPMDIDLYQSQKAIDNGKLALSDNGILLLVSKCRMGVGHDNFVKLMASSDTPKGTLDYIDKEYRVGYHKAAKLAEIALWAEMWAVTDLDDSVLESVFIKPYHDLQKAIDEAIAQKGPNAKILFMMDGSITVPMC